MSFFTRLIGQDNTNPLSNSNPLPVMPANGGGITKMFVSSVTPSTTEALLSLTPIVDGVAGTAATAFMVPTGKEWRVKSFSTSLRLATAALNCHRANLLCTATTLVATSPIVATLCCPAPAAATVGYVTGDSLGMADGLVFKAGMSVGISMIALAANAGQQVCLVVTEIDA